MMNTRFVASSLLLMLGISSLSGCATNDGIRTERAKQVDLKTLYLTTLETQYKPIEAGGKGRLGSVLDEYQNMLADRAAIEQRERERDHKTIAAMKVHLQELDAAIAQLNDQQFTSHREKRSIETNIATQQKRLRIAPNDAKADQDLSNAQNALAEIDEKIASVNADIATKQAERTIQQTLLADLISKDYSVIADQPRREYRNAVINDFLAIADFHYYEFKHLLLAGRANTDTLLDISELAISTATTLTGGVMAKTNLGAASTLLKGSRSAVDKNLFVQQTIAAIVNGIEDRRQTDRLAINRKMRQTTDQYPLSQALSDVQLYQSRASLIDGAMAVSNQAAAKANASEQALQTQ